MLQRAFNVGKRSISNNGDLLVIAEAGSNFNQDLDTSKRLIDVAAKAGADVVKFQLFSADVLYPGGGDTHAHFKAVELDPTWVPILARHATSQNIAFMASAFDAEAVQLLEDVDVPAHKVASSEVTNLKLIRQMSLTGKPLFISTGMCNLSDIHDAVFAAHALGSYQIALMQCGAVYPLPPQDANLRVMDVLESTFMCPVGYSDHTLGIGVSIAAVGRGASVIEKHFTLDREATGPDHFYALEPHELVRFISLLREAHAALGSPIKRVLPQERKYGRRYGLYAARDICAGSILTSDDLVAKRPAIGIDQRLIETVLGAKCLYDISEDEPILWAAIGS